MRSLQQLSIKKQDAIREVMNFELKRNPKLTVREFSIILKNFIV